MNVYIASRLENAAAVRVLRDELAAIGIGLTYDWTRHESVQDQGEARIAQVGRAEVQGVRDADAVVVLLPGGRGTHAELGIAIGCGKRVLLVGDRLDATGRTCALYYAEGVEFVERDDVVARLLKRDGLRATVFDCVTCGVYIAGYNDGSVVEAGWHYVEHIDGPNAICPACVADGSVRDLRSDYPDATVGAARAVRP